MSASCGKFGRGETLTLAECQARGGTCLKEDLGRGIGRGMGMEDGNGEALGGEVRGRGAFDLI